MTIVISFVKWPKIYHGYYSVFCCCCCCCCCCCFFCCFFCLFFFFFFFVFFFVVDFLFYFIFFFLCFVFFMSEALHVKSALLYITCHVFADITIKTKRYHVSNALSNASDEVNVNS